MNIRFFALVLVILLLTACNNKKENIIAQVYEESLTMEELHDLVPLSYTMQDSAIVAKECLNKWVEEQVLLHQAKLYLTAKERDFSKELENYKNALLIHAYENKYVTEHADDILITDEEVYQYYQLHLDNYILQQPIIKINYVKFPKDFVQLEQAKKMFFKDRTAAENQKMMDYCIKSAVNYYFQNKWLLFSDITKEIPIDNYNQNDFLSKKSTLEILDSNFVYLVKILDFKINEKYAPLSVVEESIRSVLLEQKKIKLLTENRNRLLQTAMQADKISIIK